MVKIINEVNKDTKEKNEDKRSSYEKSINKLKEYIESNEQNPNEKIWNQLCLDNKLLSSKTLGFLSGYGFNKLCKNIRKDINKKNKKLI